MSLSTMQITNMLSYEPKTPTRPKKYTNYHNIPLDSSPLASSPGSSPISSAQARRRTSYKTPNFSSPSSSRLPSSSSHHRTLFSSHTSSNSRTPAPKSRPPRAKEAFASIPATEGNNHKAFLRERFRARCVERAVKDRERKIAGKRAAMFSDASSDGFDELMDDADEDDVDAVLNDELFGRIMTSVNRKHKQSYRQSYSHDVGSSFDPDMYDVAEWEQDLQDEPPLEKSPEELEEEELAAYAEEYDLHLEDLPADALFSLSDLEELDEEEQEEVSRAIDSLDKGKQSASEDVDMEL
ncbi:hypothetical protein K474DRAFT_1678922 [Panus rudis PR-1116 ss-1]|nr:hypothetical protein K474DRAFT_1678922 [Panus rudis PR-1116 ss-1]